MNATRDTDFSSDAASNDRASRAPGLRRGDSGAAAPGGDGLAGARIVALAHAADWGGAERSLYETILGLRARGAEFHVVAPREGPLTQHLREADIDTSIIYQPWWVRARSAAASMSRLQSDALSRGPRRVATPGRLRHAVSAVARLGGAFAAAGRIAALARRWDAHLIYTNTLCVPAGAGAAHWLALPHVWHVREFGGADHGLAFVLGERWSRDWMLRRSARVVCNSRAVAESFAAHRLGERVEVVYQGIAEPTPEVTQPTVDWPLRAAGLRLLLMGRLAPGKGQELAIEAMKELRRRDFPATLAVVGAGQPAFERRLRQQIDAAGLRGCVALVGASQAGAAWYQASDVVLVPSRREAFGRVSVEAMLAGKPVIGARSGGTAEIVRDGETGLLFAPGDVQGLAASIIALGETTRRQAMGVAGRRRARRCFSRPAYLQAMAHQIVSALTHQCGPAAPAAL